MNVRLSAAVYAAAGACHNLDESVVLFAALYIFHHLARIAEPACHGNVYRNAAERIGSLLYALCAAHFVEHYGFVLVAEGARRKAEGRLHNAARRAEYRAAARSLTERVVELALGKVGKVEPRLLYHLCQLARGERRVGVVPEFVARNFKLFRRAGNNRNDVQVLGLYALLHAVIGL